RSVFFGGRSKNRRMISNSFRRGSCCLDVRLTARHFVGTRRCRYSFEHAVDEAIAVGRAEALAELHGFVQHHLEWRLGMPGQLVGADVQDRAFDRRELDELAAEMRHDQRAQRLGLAEHAGEQALDEARVGALEAFQRARLRERILAGELPRVERLQCDLARLAPGGFHAPSPLSRALSFHISTATRTASAPLSRRASACASSSVVRMPLAIGRPHSSATSISPRADSLATISKWWVSPRITTPSAARASKRPDCAIHCSATGISS